MSESSAKTKSIDHVPGEQAGRPMTAREVLQLPAAERDRLLEQGAAAVVEDYEECGSLRGFDAMGWEDHFDDSLPDD